MQCLSPVGPAPGGVLRARPSFIHLSIRRFTPGGSVMTGKPEIPDRRWSSAPSVKCAHNRSTSAASLPRSLKPHVVSQ